MINVWSMYDTVQEDTYLNALENGYKLVGLNFPKKMIHIQKSDIITFYDNNPNGWPKSILDIETGLYIAANLFYYHNVRELWRSVAEVSSTPVTKDIAKNVLQDGYSVLPFEKIDFRINQLENIRICIKYMLYGNVFRNYPYESAPHLIKFIADIYAALYHFNDPLRGNIQLTVAGEDPKKSKFPDVYEWRFDLPYPNLKTFYNPTNLTELNGVYSYIPKSNFYSAEKVALVLSAGVKSFDNNIFNSCSSFYTKCAIEEMVPHIINQIRLHETIKFDLPAGHLVITDNIGLHRKTAAHKGLKYMRAYLHPLPYPRSNQAFYK